MCNNGTHIVYEAETIEHSIYGRTKVILTADKQVKLVARRGRRCC
uniref:Uncharacterized protein n=1 Tax=Arundo donax TaxID=35708 RepID=A0A0A9E7U8_ARUDO